MSVKGGCFVAAFLVCAWVMPVHGQVVDGKHACWEDASCSSIGRIDFDEGKAAPKRPVVRVQAAAPQQIAVKPAAPAIKTAKVAIQVSQNDPAIMKLALNNARNIIDQYKATGTPVEVELVAYGPGLHMLRADTSPVKDRIGPMALEHPNLKFVGCANTQANQSKAEGKPVTLLAEAKATPSGVVRLIELQERGFAYVRP